MLNWLVLVVEAMVAAPLVAVMVAHPEGHHFWGKAEVALSLLLNLFIYPTLLVIGMLFCVALVYVGLDLLNLTFAAAVSNVLTGFNHSQVHESGWILPFTSSQTNQGAAMAQVATAMTQVGAGASKNAAAYGSYDCRARNSCCDSNYNGNGGFDVSTTGDDDVYNGASCYCEAVF